MKTKTEGGRLLAKGYTSDPEDARTSYRIGGAYRLLACYGAEPTIRHSDWTGAYGRHLCDYRCTAEWPAWVTGDMLDDAYALASKLQGGRGAFHQLAAIRGAAWRSQERAGEGGSTRMSRSARCSTEEESRR